MIFMKELTVNQGSFMVGYLVFPKKLRYTSTLYTRTRSLIVSESNTLNPNNYPDNDQGSSMVLNNWPKLVITTRSQFLKHGLSREAILLWVSHHESCLANYFDTFLKTLESKSNRHKRGGEVYHHGPGDPCRKKAMNYG